MSNMAGFLPSLWKRAMLRKIQFSDGHGRLNLLYKLHDPWGMESEREQHRFRETSAFLDRHVRPIESLLEVGCGEGHQTLAFKRLAQSIVGVDVSQIAIERAKSRVPGVDFIVGNVMSAPEFAPSRRFDVVTVCELLYYVKEVRPYLKTLERLGRHVLATYVDSHRGVLDPIVLSRPGVESGAIGFEGTKWTIALWPGESDR